MQQLLSRQSKHHVLYDDWKTDRDKTGRNPHLSSNRVISKRPTTVCNIKCFKYERTRTSTRHNSQFNVTSQSENRRHSFAVSRHIFRSSETRIKSIHAASSIAVTSYTIRHCACATGPARIRYWREYRSQHHQNSTKNVERPKFLNDCNTAVGLTSDCQNSTTWQTNSVQFASLCWHWLDV